MNSKHKKLLVAIFADPAPANIEWQAIENLRLAAGCQIVEGAGSRVRFIHSGHVASFHRPHPAKEAKRYQVRDVRDYLALWGSRHECHDLQELSCPHRFRRNR